MAGANKGGPNRQDILRLAAGLAGNQGTVGSGFGAGLQNILQGRQFDKRNDFRDLQIAQIKQAMAARTAQTVQQKAQQEAQQGLLSNPEFLSALPEDVKGTALDLLRAGMTQQAGNLIAKHMKGVDPKTTPATINAAFGVDNPAGTLLGDEFRRQNLPKPTAEPIYLQKAKMIQADAVRRGEKITLTEADARARSLRTDEPTIQAKARQQDIVTQSRNIDQSATGAMRLSNTVNAINSTLQFIDAGGQLTDVQTGPLTSAFNFLKKSMVQLFGKESVAGLDPDMGAVDAARSLINKMVLVLRGGGLGDGPLTGNTSDKDVVFLMGIPANLAASPEGRKLIGEIYQAIANNAVKVRDFKNSLTIGPDGKVRDLTFQDSVAIDKFIEDNRLFADPNNPLTQQVTAAMQSASNDSNAFGQEAPPVIRSMVPAGIPTDTSMAQNAEGDWIYLDPAKGWIQL